MICLDCNAAIAAFQKDPPANIAMHRERVRHFIRENYTARLLFPAIALSEYLWKAEQADLERAIQGAVAATMFAPAFDEVTATIAASLGRRFVAERKSNAEVARLTPDRARCGRICSSSLPRFSTQRNFSSPTTTGASRWRSSPEG